MTKEATDLLGNALSTDERELVDIYTRLKTLSQRDDLPPVVIANAKQAMVLMWNACNDLALICEEPGCD
ncbi:MAG TPA: hypothetical protein EYP98_00065 [Planctomycetes bacterium]|jgi:hypothetical protein|nr:hypothetical protein [Planctomycetota bacterium]